MNIFSTTPALSSRPEGAVEDVNASDVQRRLALLELHRLFPNSAAERTWCFGHEGRSSAGPAVSEGPSVCVGPPRFVGLDEVAA